jgi:hypothetical protein
MTRIKVVMQEQREGKGGNPAAKAAKINLEVRSNVKVRILCQALSTVHAAGPHHAVWVSEHLTRSVATRWP